MAYAPAWRCLQIRNSIQKCIFVESAGNFWKARVIYFWRTEPGLDLFGNVSDHFHTVFRLRIYNISGQSRSTAALIMSARMARHYLITTVCSEEVE